MTLLAFTLGTAWSSAQFAIPTRPLPTPTRLPAPTPPATPSAKMPTGGTAAPVTIPEPSVTVHNTNAPINLDTALAKLLEGQKDFMALGDMEVVSGDPKKPNRQSFVLSVNMLEGQIRTELDLRRIRPEFNVDNPFATYRQIGIHRLVSVTLPRERITHSLYPSVNAYLSKVLPAGENPAFIRAARRMVGRENIGGESHDRYAVLLIYPTGAEQKVDWWESVRQPGQPAFLKFDLGGTLISVRFSAFQPGKPPAELFKVPSEYAKYADQGVFLQAVSAKYSNSRIIRRTIVPTRR